MVFGQYEQLFEHSFENYRDLIFIFYITILFANFSFKPQLIFKLSVIVSLYTVFYVFGIYIDAPERGVGLLETPIARGNMGMLVGVMALISFFALQQKFWKILAIIGFVFGVLLSLMSGSRGGWLTIVIVILTLWMVLYRFDRKVFLVASVLFAAFFVLLLLLWPYLPIQTRVEQALNDLTQYFDGNFETSLGYRLEMWKAGFLSFLEKPLFGWGFGSFEIIYQEYIEKKSSNSSSYIFGHPHNDYVLFLVETGLIGFALMLLVLLYPLYKLLGLLKKALMSGDREVVYLSLLGVVLIEGVMEFMLTDQTLSMKYQFNFYIVFILLIFTSAFQNTATDDSVKYKMTSFSFKNNIS